MTQYIVCRTVEVTLACMVGIVDHLEKGCTWHAPFWEDNVKAFDNEEDAEKYCKEMNKVLKEPSKDGTIHIDLLPLTDYYVLPIDKSGKGHN